MFKRLTLRAQVVAVALVCVSAGLAAAFLGSSRASHAAVSQSVSGHLRSRSAELLEATRRKLEADSSAVATWASATAMQETLDTADPKFAEDYLRRTASPQSFALALLLDAERRVVAAVRPRPGQASATVDSLRGAVVQLPGNANARLGLAGEGLVAADTGRGTRLVAAAPVVDFAGDVVGHVVAVLSREGLLRLLSEGASAEGDGRLHPVLFDDTGAVTISDRPDLEPVVLAMPRDQWDHASAGAEGLTVTASGVDYLAFGTRQAASASPRLAVVAMVPANSALGPIVELRRVIVSLFAGVLLAVGLASVVVMRRAAQPLTQMVSSMETVARGDLSVRLPPQPAADLGAVAGAFNTMVEEVARSRTALAKTEAMRREVEIAHEIQTTLLPRRMNVPGFEVAARSKPASEVGGDYYDLVPAGDSFWIIMGDVSGHGLNSGLIMLMAQAAGLAAITADPSLSPAGLVRHVNAVLYENIRHRLGGDDYLTIVVAKHAGAGRFVGSGSHCPIFITRQGGSVDMVEPVGPWCGVVPDITRGTVEFEFALAAGESALLLTDGVLEAMNAAGEPFGEERVQGTLSKFADRGSYQMLNMLFSEVEAHSAKQSDDITAMVLTRSGDT